MSDLDVLKELINKKALVQLEETSYGKKTVTLGESGSQGQIQYSIKIKGIPDDAIVVKTDVFSSPESIFCVSKGRMQARRLRYNRQLGIGKLHHLCRN